MSNMVYVSGEELGRLKRAEKKAKRQAERQPQSGAPKLIETKANFSQIKIFPLDTENVTVAGGPIELSQTAQNAFQPIRGIMQASVSLDDVELSEIKVGNVSQLVVAANFPGQMFSPQADDVLCDLDVVPPGIQFRMEGVSQSIQRVTAGWFGHYFSSLNLRGR